MISIVDAARAAMDIIVSNEGSYASVNRDDNGAMSIGKLQWHGERARGLLIRIIETIPKVSAEMLGDMYNELISDCNWSKRTASADEAKRISALLVLDEAKAVQDECATEDICKDIRRGMLYGLVNCGALLYFADGANQYGRYSSMWKKAVGIALEGRGDVDALHAAVLSLTESRKARRERTYKKVKALGICGLCVVDGDVKEKDQEAGAAAFHKVARGDTLTKISRSYGVSIDDILSLNNERYPKISRNYIEIGWELNVSVPQKEQSEYDTALEGLKSAGVLDDQMAKEIGCEATVIALYRMLKLSDKEK